MSILEEERDNEAYKYARENGEISLNKLIKFNVSPVRFKGICYHNGFFVEKGTKIYKTGRKPLTIFYLIQRTERRYINGIELAACSVPKNQFITKDGTYKCLHYRHCQCYLNGNCDIGG